MSERELLFSVTRKDLIETHTRGTGNGGQARNKTSSGVRLVHPASGAVGESTASRSQEENRVEAWKKLRQSKEFEFWFRNMVAAAQGRKTLEQKIEEAMAPKNITTQILDGRSRWVDADPADLT